MRARRRHAVLTALRTDPSGSITRCPQPGCPHGAVRRRALARRWRVPARHAPPCLLLGTRPAIGPSLGRPLIRLGASTGTCRRGSSPGAREGCPRAGPGRLDGTAGVAGGCLRSRAGGQRAPSLSGRPGSAAGHRPGLRARPCRPSPPAGRGCRQYPSRTRVAPQHGPRSGLASSPAPWGGNPGRVTGAGAGLDTAGGAERPSSRTHGRAVPGMRTAPGLPPAPGTAADPLC